MSQNYTKNGTLACQQALRYHHVVGFNNTKPTMLLWISATKKTGSLTRARDTCVRSAASLGDPCQRGNMTHVIIPVTAARLSREPACHGNQPVTTDDLLVDERLTSRITLPLKYTTAGAPPPLPKVMTTFCFEYWYMYT